MNKVKSIEEAAEKGANSHIANVWGRGENVSRGIDSNADNMRDGYISGFKAGVQWQQSQPEIIAGYIHEIDSLRETNRKLGEQIEELKKYNTKNKNQ